VKNKNGQLGNISGIVLSLVVIGIVLAVGFLVLTEFKDSVGKYDRTVTNETEAWLNATAYEVEKADECNFDDFTVTAVYDLADDSLIESANYTTDSAGTITLADGKTTTSENVSVSYTYTDGGKACENVVTTTEALEKIPTWLGVIVIIAIVGILLAILFKSLPQTREM